MIYACRLWAVSLRAPSPVNLNTVLAALNANPSDERAHAL